MKRNLSFLVFFLMTAGFATSFCQSAMDPKTVDVLPAYKPADQALHDKIVALDQRFFEAYNTCDMEIQSDLMSEDLEFFHDLGGLETSKEKILEALKNNICDKVTRTLIPGTIEVYAIPNYGAIQMGWHKFHNKLEPNAISKPSKFVSIWKKEEENWRMTRVISLH